MPKKTDISLTPAEVATLNRLKRFADQHGFYLFNIKGSLFDRVRTITRNNGRCPCKHERWCPCNECLQECKNNGECFCRVFMAKR